LDELAILSRVLSNSWAFRHFNAKSHSHRNPHVEEKDFDSCKEKSQQMLTVLNEPVEITR